MAIHSPDGSVTVRGADGTDTTLTWEEQVAASDGLTPGTATAGGAVILDDNLTIDQMVVTALSTTTPQVHDHNTTITAHAGGGQGSATALTGEFNNVTTCATAADSVALPAAVAGLAITVKNSGAASLAVFPASGDSINAMAVNLSIDIPPSGVVTFRAISATVWETSEVLLSNSPSTQKGSLAIQAADNAGNTQTLITNASQAAARTYTIPDAGANAKFVMSTGAQTDAAVTSDELAKFSLAPFLVTTTSTTPASGSCAAQFVVKNAAGVAVAVPVCIRAYLTDSATGLTHTAAGTSIAVLTNGALTTDGATPSVGPHFTLTTTAAGLIGLTVTAAAGTYYIAFVMPNGKLVMSSALVVNS